MDLELRFLGPNEDRYKGRLQYADGRHVSNFGRKYLLDSLLVIFTAGAGSRDVRTMMRCAVLTMLE